MRIHILKSSKPNLDEIQLPGRHKMDAKCQFCQIYNNGERKSDEKLSTDSKSYEQKSELQFSGTSKISKNNPQT